MGIFRKAYQKPVLLTLLAFCLYTEGWCQLGLRLRQLANDTLIRDRSRPSTGVKPVINLNNYYRVHVGAKYRFATGRTEDSTLRNLHTVGLNYSITENSFHPYYKAIFPEKIGKWNISLLAGYDQVRRVNFFGIGNESPRNPNNQQFNWLRTQNLFASAGIDRTFSDKHHLTFVLTYDGIRVMGDVGRIVDRHLGIVEAAQYRRQVFFGGQALYSYQSIDRPLFPTKGFEFTSSAGYTSNTTRQFRSFARFTADVDWYLPLAGDFSLALRSGAATITGEPDFFQLNTIGGTQSLRGYQRFRFYGRTSFYNQNELRWIPHLDAKWYRGPIGVFLFFDQGRVWHPGESSNTLHNSAGGGLMLAPFNKVALTAAYGASTEDRRVHISIRKFF